MLDWPILSADIAKADPTRDVKSPKKSAKGFPAWERTEADAFRKKWPLGTRERLAFEIFDGTGLRISDVAVFGRQHVKEHVDPESGKRFRVGSLVTKKTGEQVWFVFGQALEETIAAGPCGDLTFLVTARGTPFRKESLGNWMRPAIRAAGIQKSPHGIRKLAATRDSESGWSDRELEAKYGWRGGKMAERYTDSANRQKLVLVAALRASPTMLVRQEAEN